MLKFARCLVSISIFAFISGCTIKDDSMSDIYLYKRSSGVYNGYETYGDILSIRSYHNYTYTIDSLVKISRQYIDTVKTDKPVSYVLFLGQGPGVKLPNPKRDDMFDDYRAYALIAISFSNSFPNSSSKEIEISTLSIWKNNEIFPAHSWQAAMPEDKLRIDSAINSRQPFNISR